MSAPRAPLLRVEGLQVAFAPPDQAEVLALDDVAFALHEGEVLGVVGESGCGKTTLALSLLRLLPAAGRIRRGRIEYLGRDLLDLSEGEMAAVRWRHIAMVFQGAMNALNPVRTVGDQIAEAIRNHLPPMPPAEIEAMVARLLSLVGISPTRAKHYPHQYSGGMRQRAVIAMALACTPSILIADEPTTALDVMIQAQLLALLAELRQKLGLSMILVSHDLGVVAELCDRVLVMYGGMVAEAGDVDQVFNDARHPYTRALLASFPDITRPPERMRSIAGSPPPLDPPPPGCRFAERCPEVMDRCRLEEPPAYDVGPGRTVRCFLEASR